MTLTIFVLVGKVVKDDVLSTTMSKEDRDSEDLDIKVEEIKIKDPDCQIPVQEASDDEDEEDWTERDEGPDHYGWEEVYELNDCSPRYL